MVQAERRGLRGFHGGPLTGASPIRAEGAPKSCAVHEADLAAALARVRELEEALREALYREGYCEKFTDGRLCPPHHLTPSESWVRAAWVALPEGQHSRAEGVPQSGPANPSGGEG